MPGPGGGKRKHFFGLLFYALNLFGVAPSSHAESVASRRRCVCVGRHTKTGLRLTMTATTQSSITKQKRRD